MSRAEGLREPKSMIVREAIARAGDDAGDLLNDGLGFGKLVKRMDEKNRVVEH
jgi:hypothetical protein